MAKSQEERGRLSLTREQIVSITEHITKTVGEEAFKPRKRETPFPPEIRGKGIFPAIGLKRANEYAKQLDAFAAQLSEDNRHALRHVSLRLLDDKPPPGGLDGCIKQLSVAVDTYVEHLTATGHARPQFSAVHVRYDPVAGRADVHLHGLWLVSDRARAAKYLSKRFGDVFIDKEPIRNPRSSAFYVSAGIFDYPAIPMWPEWLILECFDLSRHRFVRPAGEFAEHRREAGRAAPQPEAVDRNEALPPVETRPNRLGAALEDLKELAGVRTRLDAERAVAGQIGRSKDGAFIGRITVSSPTSLPVGVSYAVRPVSSESGRQLLNSPTLEEIELVAAYISRKLTRSLAHDEVTFCREHGITRESLRVAIAMVQGAVGELADISNKPRDRGDFLVWSRAMREELATMKLKWG